ncbi:MAG: 23S rRNA G2445 N2-methylase RlmL [Myxococcota bacterium]|jgi:23S rRNA G2445 N2-methylase RlmL
MSLTFIATTTRGAEPGLAAELAALQPGTTQPEPQLDRGAVRFTGSMLDGYRACMFSRTATRVLLPLAKFNVWDSAGLYDGVRRIDWREHLPRGASLAIDFTGTSPVIRNSHFGALKAKDAVCDALRDSAGWRPNIDLKRPDVRVNVHLRGSVATTSIDLSGTPLGQRGWRRDGGPAPLKESLAAALLRIAEWPDGFADKPFADPFCGSGTLVIEAVLAALDRAPGRHRTTWGFQGWGGHRPDLWKRVVDEADARAADANGRSIVAVGSDIDPDQLERAKANAERAGVADRIRWHHSSLDDATPPEGPAGLLVTNPPYGERLQDPTELIGLYRTIGNTLRRRWLGWSAWVFTGETRLGKAIGLRPSKRIPLFNGPIECRFLSFPIADTAPTGGGPGWRG